MVRIAPVELQYNPRTLWFDPGDLDLHDGDPVIVQTEKGPAFGHSKDIVDVSEDDVKRLRSKLKPVMRKATQKDLDRIADLRKKSAEALPVFKKLAAETNEDMHPVMVEYAFEGDRAVFFFEAEERVDFRDLVRKLASEFHIRVDMRQIGVRDQARLVGGIGHCGQELCCRRLGGEFCPVSIRMAKEQDLSLNPQKISGVCGRLMCCLRYEYDTYKEFKSRAPKVNAKIKTPRGTAKVTALNVPKEEVTVRLEEEDRRGRNKMVTFPLSAMDAPDPDAESKRPNSIGEAFEEYADPDPFQNVQAQLSFDTAGFTQEDKLGKAEAHHNPQSKRKRAEGSHRGGQNAGGRSDGHRSSRRRHGRGQGAKQNERSGQQAKGPKQGARDGGQNRPAGGQRRSRHRSHSANMNGSGQAHQRPGQKSSGLAHNDPRPQGQHAQGQHNAKGQAPQQGQHRRSRRRTHHTGGAQQGGAGDAKQS